SRPPLSESVLNRVNAALAANKRDEAITLFFTEGMGIPKPGVVFMRLLMPAWADMVRLAHTAPYDLMILTGTQAGKPLPTDRWSNATAPTMVTVGTKSESFFHSGAKALVGLLPDVRYKSLDGLDHSAVLMSPDALATAVRQFFAAT